MDQTQTNTQEDAVATMPASAAEDSSKSAHPGRTQAIIGIICSGIALLFLPPVFGITGIILGSIAIKKGRKALGITTVALAAVCMVLGAIFGAYVSIQASHLQQQSASSPTTTQVSQ